MARANLKKDFSTSTTTASKYMPKRPFYFIVLYWVFTMAKTEVIYPRNVGASIAMNFT